MHSRTDRQLGILFPVSSFRNDMDLFNFLGIAQMLARVDVSIMPYQL